MWHSIRSATARSTSTSCACQGRQGPRRSARVFANEEASPGLKRGGVLNIVRHELELICDRDKIPDEIVIDVTGFDVGDSIHISHVKLPEGSKSAITDRDFTIATVVAPSGMKSAEGDTTKSEGEA
jgi:large subunit ribosomal protein L25